MEFYQDDRLVVMLGFHHGQSLRWPSGWPGDAALFPESANLLVQWLANRGVKGPLNQVETQKKELASRRDKYSRDVLLVPERLRAAFEQGTQQFSLAVKEDVHDPIQQIQLLLMIYGASNQSWYVTDRVEGRAMAVLDSYSSGELARGVDAALRGDDRRARRGAAKFWQKWKSPLEDWKPDRADELYTIVLRLEQSARDCRVRQRALSNLERWQAELSDGEIDARLQAGIHDPDVQVRRRAMIVAGKIGHRSFIPSLLRVFYGEPLDVWPLPDVPPEETEEIDAKTETVMRAFSDPEVAALALGYLNHRELRSLIAPPEQASPAHQVALALVGEPHRLRLDHFQSANQELQLAAVEAVVRCRGKYGLAFAVQYRQATYWWEPEHVAKRLVKMLREESAPGLSAIENAKDLGPLKQWFDQFGKQYLDRLKLNN